MIFWVRRDKWTTLWSRIIPTHPASSFTTATSSSSVKPSDYPKDTSSITTQTSNSWWRRPIINKIDWQCHPINNQQAKFQSKVRISKVSTLSWKEQRRRFRSNICHRRIWRIIMTWRSRTFVTISNHVWYPKKNKEVRIIWRGILRRCRRIIRTRYPSRYPG